MKRLELVNALKAIMPGIDRQEIMTGTDSVVFENDWIRSFNEEVSVAYPFESKLLCAVRAEELYKVLNKMTDDEIKLTLAEDETHLIAEGKKTKLKMRALEETERIRRRMNVLGLDKLSPEDVPKDLMEGIELCSYSASKDSTLGVMNSVAVKEDMIAATDNYRIATYLMEEKIENDFILPLPLVINLLKFVETIEQLQVTSSWIHFVTDKDTIISSRRYAGDFPWARVRQVAFGLFEGEKETYTLPEGLEESLGRAEILSSSEQADYVEYVTLSQEKDTLLIRGKRSVGEIEENIPWGKAQMPSNIRLLISPDFLRKILPITRDFSLDSQNKIALFHTEKFNNFMVVMIE
jgi:hypothetical protein